MKKLLLVLLIFLLGGFVILFSMFETEEVVAPTYPSPSVAVVSNSDVGNTRGQMNGISHEVTGQNVPGFGIFGANVGTQSSAIAKSVTKEDNMIVDQFGRQVIYIPSAQVINEVEVIPIWMWLVLFLLMLLLVMCWISKYSNRNV